MPSRACVGRHEGQMTGEAGVHQVSAGPCSNLGCGIRLRRGFAQVSLSFSAASRQRSRSRSAPRAEHRKALRTPPPALSSIAAGGRAPRSARARMCGQAGDGGSASGRSSRQAATRLAPRDEGQPIIDLVAATERSGSAHRGRQGPRPPLASGEKPRPLTRPRRPSAAPPRRAGALHLGRVVRGYVPIVKIATENGALEPHRLRDRSRRDGRGPRWRRRARTRLSRREYFR